MDNVKTAEQLRQETRNNLRHRSVPIEGYKSDQELKKVQPPLVKPKMCETQIDLPLNFDDLKLEKNLLQLLWERKSSRIYSDEPISMLELSFLLWSAQGIKAMRGKRYATLRTAACGGARHPFELYFFVNRVEGLKPGYYHYLPMSNQIECIEEAEGLPETMNAALVGQAWAKKSSVIFVYSIVPYRVEWRGGVMGTQGSLNDMGHVGENVYLAATALNLGTCGVGAFDEKLCNKLFHLNEEEEFAIYTQTIGTLDPKDRPKEDEIYAFVKEEEDSYVN